MTDDKVILVTGSSSGIGAAVAKLAARNGYNVLVNYNSNQAGADEVVDYCQQQGVDALSVGADVGEDAACRAMVDAAVERWGRVDSLVNNAGTTKFCGHADLEGLDAEDFHNLYRVNTVGAFQMIRAVVPTMKKTGGSIVNVASVAGSNRCWQQSRVRVLQGGHAGAEHVSGPQPWPEIRVNAVCPGMVEGDWLAEGLGEELYPMVKQHYETQASTGEIMNAETVAENIWFFVDSAPNVTGEHLLLDGGATLPY